MTTDTPAALTVAVVGTGFIGGTLGRAFARAGYPTVFGARNPDSGSAAAQDGGATSASIAEAISRADVVVLALPAAAVEDLLVTHGEALADKLVVDAANNVGAKVAHHAELVGRLAPKARYARAFNTLGGENFADPDFGGTAADLFYSASEVDRPTLDGLIAAVGLRPMYLGEGQEDAVDGVLRLWFLLAIAQGHGRNLAFHTLTR